MLKQIIILVLVISAVTFTGCASDREIKVNNIPVPAEEPDEEQIQADLVGSNLRWKGGEEVWYFTALSEFDNVSINNKLTRGDAIEFDVTFLLKDFELEKHFILDAFLVYKLYENQWQLRSYLVTDFREITLQTHLE
ncbi:hypothetical protein ACFLXY_01250 [Chloroflexota bacterium]